ncbi:MAG TPA: LLM class flavin-dependent oxidoreductase [Polyangia bacterium]|nr:LLM class flavin-dependent oxidoreductase [Polyangia bacterium]
MIPFSVLDLAPIVEGGDAGLALRNAADLARHAEGWGFSRFWLAEHHNMPGIASAATAVAIGHVAAQTSTIRVGAGGIMLPNHAPLVIAEQFGTLDALYPGRIDLGLGRAPGTDPLTAHALRRGREGGADGFPDSVQELMSYFGPFNPDRRVHAVPGAGAQLELWILGSSLFGAQLAGALGLPYAFASHFAPALLLQAIEVYRRCFRPSPARDRPRVMIGVPVVAAGTDAEARLLATSLEQAFVNLRGGRPGRLPPPRAGYTEQLSLEEAAMLEEVLACAAIGAPGTVSRRLETLIARTQADEVILTSQIFDHRARLRSFEIAAGLLGGRGQAARPAAG